MYSSCICSFYVQLVECVLHLSLSMKVWCPFFCVCVVYLESMWRLLSFAVFAFVDVVVCMTSLFLAKALCETCAWLSTDGTQPCIVCRLSKVLVYTLHADIILCYVLAFLLEVAWLSWLLCDHFRGKFQIIQTAKLPWAWLFGYNAIYIQVLHLLLDGMERMQVNAICTLELPFKMCTMHGCLFYKTINDLA